MNFFLPGWSSRSPESCFPRCRNIREPFRWFPILNTEFSTRSGKRIGPPVPPKLLVMKVRLRLHRTSRNLADQLEALTLSGDDEIQLLVDERDVDVALPDEGVEKDLIAKFTSFQVSQPLGTEIEMETEQEWSKHISSLPMEILIAILKWVVSDQLDLRSLEKCSAVCRCFYVASRSPDLWRIICLNMWGANALPLDAGDYIFI